MSRKLKLNLYETLDYKELAELIFNLWKDGALKESQSKYNSDHISEYSWNNVALQYLSFLQNIP